MKMPLSSEKQPHKNLKLSFLHWRILLFIFNVVDGGAYRYAPSFYYPQKIFIDSGRDGHKGYFNFIMVGCINNGKTLYYYLISVAHSGRSGLLFLFAQCGEVVPFVGMVGTFRNTIISWG